MKNLENQDGILRHYPHLLAGMVAESIGYMTPDHAALALLRYKKNEPHHCEMYWAWNGFEQGRKLGPEFDADLLKINREFIASSCRNRQHHSTNMDSYQRALAIVKRQAKTGEGPELASWF